MKTTSSILAISCFIINTPVFAESESTGKVNFNLGRSPVTASPLQPVTLYGCNQKVNSNLFWDTDNQIVGNIPYGSHKSESGKNYHISKYYISSPPAFRTGLKHSSKKQQPYIGLVTPDRFTFTGKKPAQIVYFDYRILKPTYLNFISINYDKKNKYGHSCSALDVDSIPLNIQCSDFPWRNGALGASGIAEITQESNQVFLPLVGEKKKPLQCSVSILDDIILDHDIYFLDKKNKQHKTTNLTQHHIENKDITLICYHRSPTDIPSGCTP